ncbi:nuclear transport factor 2 family protein (plasmid) [Pseudoalteromonas sp. T1lg65]|uniref:nuclear transport factor 2 family protein n=1 Tax=Pseudoalteromonas sp. T1lg65 TaxID=2077101 RepID=UPI003F78BA2C
MKKHVIFSTLLLLAALLSNSSKAMPTSEQIHAFVAASEQARSPTGDKAAVEKYLAYFTPDYTDHHIAYDVSFTGLEQLRKGIENKRSTMVSLSETVEDIILGTNTAVVVVNEDSKYYKKDKLKHFKGRTILVLEFNDQGLISQMRRYLD